MIKVSGLGLKELAAVGAVLTLIVTVTGAYYALKGQLARVLVVVENIEQTHEENYTRLNQAVGYNRTLLDEHSIDLKGMEVQIEHQR